MIHKDHMSMNHSGIFLGVSHCKCSVDINGGEYIVPNIEKYTYHKVLINGYLKSNEHLKQEIIFPTLTTESPPISIDLVSTIVLLI